MKVLIIGAAGKVGSATLKSCLAKDHIVTAFIRNPSKLPQDMVSHPNIRIVKGDAMDKDGLVEAMKGQDAVIQTAVYGSVFPWGSTSESEQVVQTVVSALKHVQSTSSSSIRLWVLSGQVLLDIPGTAKKIEGDYIPVHPEHYKNYEYLQKEAGDIDWSLLCPAKIDDAEPVGPLVITLDEIGLYHPPGIIGSLPIIGGTLNIMYNFSQQRLSFKSLGDFLASHLGPGGEMKGRRVGILEDRG